MYLLKIGYTDTHGHPQQSPVIGEVPAGLPKPDTSRLLEEAGYGNNPDFTLTQSKLGSEAYAGKAHDSPCPCGGLALLVPFLPEPGNMTLTAWGRVARLNMPPAPRLTVDEQKGALDF